MTQQASLLELLGAGGFGAVVGWFLYYLNRYRTGEVQLADLVSVIGAIGGGAVLALFPAESELFGAYGIGLFFGFFGYLVTLALLVRHSQDFTADWFLDGRRIAPKGDVKIQRGQTAMGPGSGEESDEFA